MLVTMLIAHVRRGPIDRKRVKQGLIQIEPTIIP